MSSSNLSRSGILSNLVTTPRCLGLEEQPSASAEREKLQNILSESDSESQISLVLVTPLGTHLAYGLAYTTGSALGSIPPNADTCLAAFTAPNKVKLTAGARAWSKHAHRSVVEGQPPAEDSESENKKPKQKIMPPTGWWGNPSGPVAVLNENALALFWKIFGAATWRNLHWLPHSILVYEIRVAEGYGMRWSQDQSSNVLQGDVDADSSELPPWIFRGFVEPMMENGHELGWRHAP